MHSVKRPQLVAESSLDPGSSYVTVGAYNHGGQYGVTKYTSEAPELTKKLTELLQLDFPSESFTSATLVKNTYMPTHKDECNDKDYRNLVSPLKVTEGGGDEGRGCFRRTLPRDASQGSCDSGPGAFPEGTRDGEPEEVALCCSG